MQADFAFPGHLLIRNECTKWAINYSVLVMKIELKNRWYLAVDCFYLVDCTLYHILVDPNARGLTGTWSVPPTGAQLGTFEGRVQSTKRAQKTFYRRNGLRMLFCRFMDGGTKPKRVLEATPPKEIWEHDSSMLGKHSVCIELALKRGKYRSTYRSSIYALSMFIQTES